METVVAASKGNRSQDGSDSNGGSKACGGAVTSVMVVSGLTVAVIMVTAGCDGGDVSDMAEIP